QRRLLPLVPWSSARHVELCGGRRRTRGEHRHGVGHGVHHSASRRRIFLHRHCLVVSEAGSEFTLEPNTFRLLSGFGFLTYVVAFMLGAPLAFGVGVVAWRTRLLPALAGGGKSRRGNRRLGELHLHHDAYLRRLDPYSELLPRFPASYD